MLKSVKIGKHLSRLIDAATEIQNEGEPSEKDKAFLTRQLVQVTLPHSDPGDIPNWERKNGNLSLSIRPGWDKEKKKLIGYPYGSIPRLILFWITTEALRTQSRKIHLGASLSSFLREIGLNPYTGRGKRGDAQRLRYQMECLFRATISLEFNNSHLKNTKFESGRKSWLDMQIAPEGELWWDFKNPGEVGLFDSWIELGEKFYDAIITSPVPLDKRALKALKNSPLALDLYSWATYKTFSLDYHKKSEQFIPWRSFMLQLGAEYTDLKNFKRKAKQAFKKVQSVYPGLNIENAEGGIIIKKGIPAIKYKPFLKKLSTESTE
jgi:hypothetical protein